jgi:hypothetical protein
MYEVSLETAEMFVPWLASKMSSPTPPAASNSAMSTLENKGDGQGVGMVPILPEKAAPSGGAPLLLYLTPVQSCNLHGWMKPKRTLSWEDIKASPALTLSKCLQHGVSAEDLRRIEPDVRMWIKHKRVSFGEVPLMTAWPLHPVQDLKGNISDLASMHYAASTLYELGITYEYLREVMKMDDEWMRMMRYTPTEWAQMGFARKHAASMGRKRVQDVFKMDYDALLLAIAAAA